MRMVSTANAIAIAVFVSVLVVAISYYIFMSLGSRGTGEDFSYAHVSIGSSGINGTYWIANTMQEEKYGYMNASSPEVLGNGERCDICNGMLFEFGYNQGICMWMKNTKMQLVIRWFYLNGSLSYERIGIPYNTTPYCAYSAYVLETEVQGA